MLRMRQVERSVFAAVVLGGSFCAAAGCAGDTLAIGQAGATLDIDRCYGKAIDCGSPAAREVAVDARLQLFRGNSPRCWDAQARRRQKTWCCSGLESTFPLNLSWRVRAAMNLAAQFPRDRFTYITPTGQQQSLYTPALLAGDAFVGVEVTL